MGDPPDSPVLSLPPAGAMVTAAEEEGGDEKGGLFYLSCLVS
jgi:hypothetical protein